MRSKASLGSSREVVQDCGVSFANYLYLVPLIIGQNFCATCAIYNQTEPWFGGLPEEAPPVLLYYTTRGGAAGASAGFSCGHGGFRIKPVSSFGGRGETRGRAAGVGQRAARAPGVAAPRVSVTEGGRGCSRLVGFRWIRGVNGESAVAVVLVWSARRGFGRLVFRAVGRWGSCTV